ncbi:DUF3515 domain-containing protein [Streptomyces cinnamoneus]|uniref:DUF3515 domain-containing protein n=1 Tax=Streptomyces cinnamoneus TaxID=53446 RepID=UPI00342C228A
MTFSLRRPFVLPAVALLSACAACSATDAPAGPAVPTPSARQAVLCRALHGELPAEVDGLKKRATDPVSDFTAAWGGGPSVTLRCGVPKSAVVARATNAVEIDGISWVPEELRDGSVRCTTVLREATVEVTLPKETSGGFGALSDLAEAIRKTVPEGIAG